MSDTFVKRQVRSRPGLTQDEALQSLQEHPDFKDGTKIEGFKLQGSRYVATLLEPKQAEFPPKKKDEEDDSDDENALEKAVEGELSEGPPSDDEDSDDSDGDSNSDGPPSPDDSDGESDGPPKPGKPGEEKGEGAQLGEILALLHKLTDALGLNEPDAALTGGPEGPPPPPGPKGPPPPGAGGPPGGPGRPPAPKPLKPGMAPPGTTPVGAPAFASVQEMATKIPSFTATTDEEMTIEAAKEDLEATYDPYKVKQIRRKEGKLHALLSVR